ncbi:MAG: hypothetical protein IFK94_09705 [Acidobacteria bacterium]|uniref:Uncharacterized protein n=1 Tax=Candidatus Polarisedimenticola svalbardensis TaxID=2886004 RepID=A0A8J6Y1F4_9BACT|nr:hypothetical protein [Candidatus Polarisedimenticola svalbardensis]
MWIFPNARAAPFRSSSECTRYSILPGSTGPPCQTLMSFPAGMRASGSNRCSGRLLGRFTITPTAPSSP